MWLQTRIGFFSIVQKPEDAEAGTLTMRARVRADLERMRACLPALGPITADAGTDYRYRAKAPKLAVASALAQLATEIDYSNFKNTVKAEQGAPRAQLYGKLWQALYALQDDPAFDTPASPRSPETLRIPKAATYGGVLIDEAGRVLLREPTNHYLGYVWTFAKGTPEPGETPLQTALKEVQEETGYAAEPFDVLPQTYVGTGGSTAFYLMRPVGAQGKPDGETASTRWVSFDEAPDLIRLTQVIAGRKRDLHILSDARLIYESRHRVDKR
jgi:8-oxo-dGTP pyrophosphatase MutT (NUDIX family)